MERVGTVPAIDTNRSFFSCFISVVFLVLFFCVTVSNVRRRDYSTTIPGARARGDRDGGRLNQSLTIGGGSVKGGAEYLRRKCFTTIQ